MDITKLKYYIDEHLDAYANISFIIATIAGVFTCLYYHNCWWFFPPFAGILFVGVVFDWFLYKFS